VKGKRVEKIPKKKVRRRKEIRESMAISDRGKLNQFLGTALLFLEGGGRGKAGNNRDSNCRRQTGKWKEGRLSWGNGMWDVLLKESICISFH